jgi:hypothetical protein
MKKLVCPQCKIYRFRVKNDKGDSVLVNVIENFEIVPVNNDDSLDGFDLETIYCLGCSWSGSPKKLNKY